jgi:DNA polymerase-3 subunit beta
MKFNCDTKKLHAALQLVSTVVPAKSPREILQNVLIDAQDGCVHLAGTDLEVGIRFVIPDVAVEINGKVLAEAAQLTQIVREASGKTITFDSPEPLQFTVSYQGSTYDLKGADPEEFPEVPIFEGEAVEVDASVLSGMIEHTSFAAARESVRFAINGVLFVVKDGTAHMVGTDGHRLAWIKKKVEIASDVSFNGIVPLKALDVLQRLLQDSKESVKLKLEENFILAQCGQGVVASKLVEGSYPNYEDVVPRENDRIVTIGIPEMTSAVRQAAVLTSDESRALRATFADGKMTLTSRVPERGGAKIERNVEFEGEAVNIGFNPDYLLDVLKITEGETIQIELKDKDRPALFKNGDDYLYVVMPVSIEG